MIKIWVDASFSSGSSNCSWGASFNCPKTGETIHVSGTYRGVKTSTHAEIAGVYDCMCIVSEMYPKEKFELRIDCKSIVDMYEYPNDHKTKDLEIGRLLYKLNSMFGNSLRLKHVKGHSPKENQSEDAVRNRDAHRIANDRNRKHRTSA